MTAKKSQKRRKTDMIKEELNREVTMVYYGIVSGEEGYKRVEGRHVGKLIEAIIGVKGYFVRGESRTLQLPRDHLKKKYRLNGMPVFEMRDSYQEIKWRH